MSAVKLTDIMKERQILSFELFPPKTEKGMRYRSLGINGIHLYALNKWRDITDIINESGMCTCV